MTNDYEPLLPAISSMNVRQFVLGNTTPRAGGIGGTGKVLAEEEIGLGVANLRTDEVEIVTDIVPRVEGVLEFFLKENVFLNPTRGFENLATDVSVMSRPVSEKFGEW